MREVLKKGCVFRNTLSEATVEKKEPMSFFFSECHVLAILIKSLYNSFYLIFIATLASEEMGS